MGEKLGQHFLKNKSVIPKIIATLGLHPGDTLIEIGPGEGALTLPLAETCQKIGCKLVAIEKDHELVNKLEDLKINSLEIVEGDALEVLPKLTERSGNFKIVGNIPYYITGHLLRIISELDNKPKVSVLMIQQEVAERVSAQPPKMNLLAAATQIWAESEVIARLKPRDFDPPPKVDSAIIKLTTKQLTITGKNLMAGYYRLIKVIFKQPRKTTLNNLADGLQIPKSDALKLLTGVNLTGRERPQNLSLDQLLKLSTKI